MVITWDKLLLELILYPFRHNHATRGWDPDKLLDYWIPYGQSEVLRKKNC